LAQNKKLLNDNKTLKRVFMSSGVVGVGAAAAAGIHNVISKTNKK